GKILRRHGHPWSHGTERWLGLPKFGLKPVQQAMGVYEAARQGGLSIPQDLSVVGFDDLPMCEWLSPPLTTVRQPLEEMGRLAAHTLFRLLDGQPLVSPRMELSTELKVRLSTAPPRL
ncbi:substrate-binding domain-containing protein, partial [Streptomyces sp. NPDC048551]|uniref:substrate-binding domain-containing protein n=1 Tax=Streptomyces sp. NPDC048551 TaxID=3155758 RepID=UPI003415F473